MKLQRLSITNYSFLSCPTSEVSYGSLSDLPVIFIIRTVFFEWLISSIFFPGGPSLPAALCMFYIILTRLPALFMNYNVFFFYWRGLLMIIAVLISDRINVIILITFVWHIEIIFHKFLIFIDRFFYQSKRFFKVFGKENVTVQGIAL